MCAMVPVWSSEDTWWDGCSSSVEVVRFGGRCFPLPSFSCPGVVFLVVSNVLSTFAL